MLGCAGVSKRIILEMHKRNVHLQQLGGKLQPMLQGSDQGVNGLGWGGDWNPADPELRHWGAPSCSLSLLSSLQALLVLELQVR